MKQFFQLIKQSVYDPIFYQELLSRPAKFSVKYFLGLSLFLSVLLTIILSVPLVPLVNAFMNALPAKVLETYPDELVLHFDKGVMSSNVTEPYFIEIPQFLRTEMKGDEYAHLAVIDTQATVTPEQFVAYQSPLWLARTSALVADGNHSVKIQQYGTQSSFTLDEPFLKAFIARIQPYFIWVAPIVVLIIFVPLFTVLLFNFVYLILGALLIFLLGRFVLKQKWSYGTSYRIGLHAVTLPVLVNILFGAVSASLNAVPFLPTILLLVVVYANYKPNTTVKSVSSDTPSGATLPVTPESEN